MRNITLYSCLTIAENRTPYLLILLCNVQYNCIVFSSIATRHYGLQSVKVQVDSRTITYKEVWKVHFEGVVRVEPHSPSVTG